MFHDCKTKDEIHKRYRELAKVLHPDHGGTDKLMRLLQDERKRALDGNAGYANHNNGFGIDKVWYEARIDALMRQLNVAQTKIARLTECVARSGATRELFLERKIDNAIQVIDRQEREIDELETQVKHMEYLLNTQSRPITFWERVKFVFLGGKLHTRIKDD